MKFRVSGLVIAVFVCCAAVAHAQAPLTLQISGGRVTLHAQNVPVRTILAEWARLGGATIVNGDRIAGAPVTLELEGVSERQALDIILRGVSGYMLAAREPGASGASMYDRIMILPTSVAPRNPPPTAAAPIFPGGPGQADRAATGRGSERQRRWRRGTRQRWHSARASRAYSASSRYTCWWSRGAAANRGCAG